MTNTSATMRPYFIFSAAVLLIILVLGRLIPRLIDREDTLLQSRLVMAVDVSDFSLDKQSFARATSPQPFSFPRDHGAHPDYQTEWWYFTGNLTADDGRHFGYQLTFFRRALLPPIQRMDRRSSWASDQAYMAHFALTDVAADSYQAYERLTRGAAGLAGAQPAPFHVWLENWAVRETDSGVYLLSVSQAGVEIELELRDVKGPVLQGDNGYSQKGPEIGNASYYYSLTRLESNGTVEIDDRSYSVRGLSWMDHEYSTSALSEGQIGWDWFSIQLDDDSELMVFQLRRQDGSIDPYSSGAWIAPDGSIQRLSREDFQLEVQGRWKSPHSGATYPSVWILSLPAYDLRLEIQPYIKDQELNVSYSYWEGAVKITGSHQGAVLRGYGYVELTGYSGSMSGEF